MTYLGTTDIERLKNRPHNTKLWLSIYQPKTVLYCLVNDSSAAKGNRILPYDGASGDYTQIKNGMTAFVTSSSGESKGRIRVRSATSGTVTVAENSHIQWEDNDILEIVNFFEINAVYPRIIQDPSNDENTLWYKDYDLVYTNQNSVLGSFVCMGSHFAGFIGDDNKCWIYYTASGTSSLVGGTLTYHWNFQSGTSLSPSGTSYLDAGWIYYQNPGHYTTELIVSGSVGGVDKSYRHISIYERPDRGTNVPILNWELVDLNGDRESGGYTATIRLLQNVPRATIRDGALVVLFADDWYSGEKVSIGGNQPTRETIVFSGYILNGSIRYNYQYSAVEFDVGSPTMVMQQSECFAVSITDSPTDPVTDYNNNRDKFPSPWVLVEDLGVARGIYHYLRWHSTVMNCCDIRYLSDDRAIYGQDFDRASLYDAVNTLISGALLGRCVSDRQGTIWFERDIYVSPDSYSTGTNYFVTKRDWMGEPSIEERQTEETSYIEIGGVAYTQSIDESIPLLAAIPGTAPGYRGGVERVQGLALLNQAELNAIGGYLYNYKNVRYPDISIDLAGNYRNADIAPQEKWHVQIAPEDTIRQLSVDINTFVKSVSFVYDPEQETLLTSVSLAEISGALSGDTLVIPPEPPDPEPPEPPHPPDPPGSPPTGTSTPTGTAVYYGIAYAARSEASGTTSGLYYTNSFSSATGTTSSWSKVDSHPQISVLFVDETDPTYAYFIRESAGEVWRYIVGGGSAVLSLDAATARTLCGRSPGSGNLASLWVDKATGYVYTMLFAGFSFADVLESTNHGSSWHKLCSVSYADPGLGGLSVRLPYIWVCQNFGASGSIACTSNSGSTWIAISTSVTRPMIDPVYPNICWGVGSDGVLRKYVYSGGAISVFTKTTPSASTTESLWINPANSSHQKLYRGDTQMVQTFDEWATYLTYTVPTDGFPVTEQICQQRWSPHYNWGAYEAPTAGTFRIYAAPTISGSYAIHNGTNYLTPPYTNAVPGDYGGSVRFGFWAGVLS